MGLLSRRFGKTPCRLLSYKLKMTYLKMAKKEFQELKSDNVMWECEDIYNISE